MSRHHMKAISNIALSLKVMNIWLILLIQIRVDRTKHSAPFEARIGQGLFSTRWNGLNFSIII